MAKPYGRVVGLYGSAGMEWLHIMLARLQVASEQYVINFTKGI